MRLLHDARGYVLFEVDDRAESGAPAPVLGGEPQVALVAESTERSGTTSLRLARASAEWSETAVYARLIILDWGVDFDVDTGALSLSLDPWPSYGLLSAFHIGDGYWITVRHGLFRHSNAEYWLARNASLFSALWAAHDSANAAGHDLASGAVGGNSILGPVEFIGWSWAHDLALFRGPEPGGGAVLELAGVPATARSTVMTAQRTRGIVTGDNRAADAFHQGSVAVTARVWGGMSGGPMVNDCGRVIGLVMARARSAAGTWSHGSSHRGSCATSCRSCAPVCANDSGR